MRLVISLLLLSTLTFTGYTQQRKLTGPQAEVVAAERAFARLSVEKGVRASFIEYFADDGIGFSPHPYKVKETLSSRPVQNPRPPTVLDWAPITGGIALAGDLAWNTGPTVFKDNSAEKGSTNHGMFFSVWKKQPDGNWRVVLDLGISTPSAVAPLDAPFQPVRQELKKPMAVNVQQEIEVLLKLEREFIAAAQAANMGQAYRSRLSDDGRIHRPDLLPITGKRALDQWLSSQTMKMSGEPIKADVARSGDLGYVCGSYELTGVKSEKGYYARVWRRDEQGRWWIVMDAINPIPAGK